MVNMESGTAEGPETPRRSGDGRTSGSTPNIPGENEEYESAYALLRSLPASFHAVITTIDRVDEDQLTLRLVEDKLLQEELKRKALGQNATSSNTGNLTTSAFFSASSSMSQNAENNAAVPNFKPDRRSMTCSHCNRKGHDVKTCFQLHPHLKPVEKSYLFLATLQEQAIDTKKDTI